MSTGPKPLAACKYWTLQCVALFGRINIPLCERFLPIIIYLIVAKALTTHPPT